MKRKKKERTFVRGLKSANYILKEELKRLRSMPRVIHTDEIPCHGGPQAWGKHFIHPESGLGQSIHMHIEDLTPGGHGKKHGHQNEAVFYILGGQGHEIHDGKRYEWEAGDIVVVHNQCVHQHINDDTTRPARALVIKTKPLFIFMNLIFQHELEPTPKDPLPGWEDYRPIEYPGGDK